jgi:hypothetical protein
VEQVVLQAEEFALKRRHLAGSVRRLEGNNLPGLRRIFVRLQGVKTGA